MRARTSTGRHRSTVRGIAALLAGSSLVIGCAGLGAPQIDSNTVYFLRHAEVDLKDPERPLNDKGRARAESLAAYFAGTSITHVYFNHTNRTRDTLVPLAKSRGLDVRQFPAPGSELDGKVVVNRTAETAAIEPMVAALRSLPAGSTAVVTGNSSNLFPVMAGVGVRADAACTAERTDCLPCITAKCFDAKSFNNIWKVVIRRDGQVILSRMTYGD